jgi:hypothetical protein
VRLGEQLDALGTRRAGGRGRLCGTTIEGKYRIVAQGLVPEVALSAR